MTVVLQPGLMFSRYAIGLFRRKSERSKEYASVSMGTEIMAINSMKIGLKEIIYLHKVFHSLSLDKHVKDRLIGFNPSFSIGSDKIRGVNLNIGLDH